MRIRLASLLLYASIVAMFAGCDPVRTVQQSVTFSLRTNNSNADFRNMRIRIRELWEQTGDSARFYEFNPDRPTASEWYVGTTDVRGRVKITVTQTAIDSHRGQVPANREAIKGRRFECEVYNGDKLALSFKGTLHEGAKFVGKTLSVTVNCISKPHYVQTGS